MKKAFILFASILIISSTSGCMVTYPTQKSLTDSSPSPTVNIITEAAATTTTTTVAQSPVTVSDLPLSIKIQKPDSIGQVYIEATYKNNSKKKVKSYEVTLLLKDSNEKTYLTSADTVLPGETSPKFESFGPKSQKKDDVEVLSFDITLANDDGTTTFINYDAKLKQYTVY